MFLTLHFQIYIGQIPRDVYEDQLIPLFEPLGTIWDLRIMMDPINGKSRGYAFLIYIDKTKATEAAKKVCFSRDFRKFEEKGLENESKSLESL